MDMSSTNTVIKEEQTAEFTLLNKDSILKVAETLKGIFANLLPSQQALLQEILAVPNLICRIKIFLEETH
jgi:hypothetical protein